MNVGHSTFLYLFFCHSLFFSGLYEIIFTPGNEGERTGHTLRHTPRFERRKWKDEGKLDIKFPPYAKQIQALLKQKKK
jgi:hypothetical protein